MRSRLGPLTLCTALAWLTSGACARLEMNPPANTAPVFWNTLGSAQELTNSVAGGPITPGALASFVPGVAGDALFAPDAGAVDQRPRFKAQGFKMDCFAMEFSVKATGLKDGRPRTMLDRVAEGDQSIAMTCRNGYTAFNTVFVMDVGRASGNQRTLSYLVDHGSQAGCNAFFPLDTWVHIAVSVDAQRAPGDRVRIWRDRVPQAVVADIDETIPGVDANADEMLMATHYWADDGFLGAMDEIKIYGYAKDDFAVQP